MTSTNDGKDVKSNQSSGQKGKSYYIDIYKSLDVRLSSECDLRTRTQHLCESWRRIRSLCQHSLPTTHLHLLSWLQRHTAKTVLQTEWTKPESEEERKSLEVVLDAFVEETSNAAASRDGKLNPWELQLLQRAEWFKSIQSNPWEHPVLNELLNPRENPPTDEQITEWLRQERSELFTTRLRQLGSSKDCKEFALSMASAVMDRIRASTAVVPDNLQAQETSLDKSSELLSQSSFADTLTAEAGFTAADWELITDIEFVLLVKVDRARTIELAKRTPLRDGSRLVERLNNRLEKSPHEKKLWKNAKEVATLIAHMIITRCMVIPVVSESVRAALHRSCVSLARALPPPRLRAALGGLAAPAATARHLHALCHAVTTQCPDMKACICELYVRTITAGMNELERLKLKTEKESEARSTEIMLSSWFTQLGKVLSSSARINNECLLTAFSVHPAPLMYELIHCAPALPRGAKAVNEPLTPATEFGSWANDSHAVTNLVKTSENLKLQRTERLANVLSTEFLAEGEALGLSAELCQDLAVLLAGPRVKTLSWDMDRELLLQNCRSYMERTHGGTRALTTELKYLNLDPKQFAHLQEEDDDENDAYYGIEKGYEHLVELEEPEAIWQDAVFTHDSDSTCSESTAYTQSSRRKKATSVSSEEESNPLSVVAETKRNKKKERPHSKERSREKPPIKKKVPKTVKVRVPKPVKEKVPKPVKIKIPKPVKIKIPKPVKEKVPRPKKEKKERVPKPPKEAKPASYLVNDKVKQIRKMLKKRREYRTKVKTPCVTDSDYDSQGKSSLASLNSEENESDAVVFDGLFSMDDIDPLKKEDSLINSELSFVNGQVSTTNTQAKAQSKTKQSNTSNYSKLMPKFFYNPVQKSQTVSSDVKKSITQFIQNRQYTSNIPPSNTSSPQRSSMPQAIIKPDETRLQSAIISPKPIEVPEIPALIIDKKQTELLKNMKADANSEKNIKKAATSRSKSIKEAKIASNNPNETVMQIINNYKIQLSQQNAILQSHCAHIQNNSSPFSRSHEIVEKPFPNPAKSLGQKAFEDFLNNKNLRTICVNSAYQPMSNYSKHEDLITMPVKQNAEPNTHAPKKAVKPSKPSIHQEMEEGTPAQKQLDELLSKGCASRTLPISYQQKRLPKGTMAPTKTDYDNFLRELQMSINAGADTIKNTVTHANRTTHIPTVATNLKADKITPHSAKSLVTQKKTETAPNTFSRLSYMHRNKQNETNKFQCNIPPSDVPATKLSEELDRILANHNITRSNEVKISKVEKVQKDSRKVDVSAAKDPEVVITKATNKPNVTLTQKNPLLSNKLTTSINTHSAPIKVTQTTGLTEKDQLDLISLLRQQSNLNLSKHQPSIYTYNNIEPPKSTITSTSHNNAAFNNPTVLLPTAQHNAESKGIAKIMPLQYDQATYKDIKPVDTKVSTCIPTLEQHGTNNKIQNITKGLSTYAPAPKTKQQSQDWESVVNALLAHKTPSRGPSALDMVLNKYPNDKLNSNKYTTSSLRNQRIVKTKPITQANNIQADILNIPKYTPTKNDHTTVDTKTKSVPGTKAQKDIDKIALKTGTSNQNLRKSEMSRKQKKTSIRAAPDLSKSLIIDATPKTFDCELTNEDDPFISSILHSDYDLLEELMDDDLRKEIGELSGDDESYRKLDDLAIKSRPESVTKKLAHNHKVQVVENYPTDKPIQNDIANSKSGVSGQHYAVTNVIQQPPNNSNIIVQLASSPKVLNMSRTPKSVETSLSQPASNIIVTGSQHTQNIFIQSLGSIQNIPMTTSCNLIQNTKANNAPTLFYSCPAETVNQFIISTSNYAAIQPTAKIPVSAMVSQQSERLTIPTQFCHLPASNTIERSHQIIVQPKVNETVYNPVQTDPAYIEKMPSMQDCQKLSVNTNNDLNQGPVLTKEHEQKSPPNPQNDELSINNTSDISCMKINALTTTPSPNLIPCANKVDPPVNVINDCLIESTHPKMQMRNTKEKHTTSIKGSRPKNSRTASKSLCKGKQKQNQTSKKEKSIKLSAVINTLMNKSKAHNNKTTTAAVLNESKNPKTTDTKPTDHQKLVPDALDTTQIQLHTNAHIQSDADKERLKSKWLALINRKVNHRCFYPAIPLQYSSLSLHKTSTPDLKCSSVKSFEAENMKHADDSSKNNGLIEKCINIDDGKQELSNCQTDNILGEKSSNQMTTLLKIMPDAKACGHDNVIIESKTSNHESVSVVEKNKPYQNDNIVIADLSGKGDFGATKNSTNSQYALSVKDQHSLSIESEQPIEEHKITEKQSMINHNKPKDANKNNSKISDDDYKSIKDDIIIEELPSKPGENPLKKCIRFKLRNGKSFKATIHGTMLVNFDTLFSDPALKTVLLEHLKDENAKCTVNIKQISKPGSNANVKTQIQDINVLKRKRVVETVSLLSDDEDDNPHQTITTDFGTFKYNSTNECYNINDHAKKIFQKCYVKLNKLPIENVENCESIEPKEKSVNTTDVIEIDDSDTDNEIKSSDNITAPIIEHIDKTDIMQLKNALLKDLGVADNVNITENANAGTIEILSDTEDENPVPCLKNDDPKLSQKCFIPMNRCDKLLDKCDIAMRDNENDVSDDEFDAELSDALDCDIPEETTLSRSGSYSILNDFTIYENLQPSNPSSPVIGVFETISRLQYMYEAPTSPVMKIYDDIVTLNEKLQAQVNDVYRLDNIEISACGAEWFEPKSKLKSYARLFVNAEEIYVFTAKKKEDQHFNNFELYNALSLKTTMLDYFGNQDVIDQLIKSYDLRKDKERLPPLKRKSAFINCGRKKVIKPSKNINDNSSHVTNFLDKDYRDNNNGECKTESNTNNPNKQIICATINNIYEKSETCIESSTGAGCETGSGAVNSSSSISDQCDSQFIAQNWNNERNVFGSLEVEIPNKQLNDVVTSQTRPKLTHEYEITETIIKNKPKSHELQIIEFIQENKSTIEYVSKVEASNKDTCKNSEEASEIYSTSDAEDMLRQSQVLEDLKANEDNVVTSIICKVSEELKIMNKEERIQKDDSRDVGQNKCMFSIKNNEENETVETMKPEMYESDKSVQNYDIDGKSIAADVPIITLNSPSYDSMPELAELQCDYEEIAPAIISPSETIEIDKHLKVDEDKFAIEPGPVENLEIVTNACNSNDTNEEVLDQDKNNTIKNESKDLKNVVTTVDNNCEFSAAIETESNEDSVVCETPMWQESNESNDPQSHKTKSSDEETKLAINKLFKTDAHLTDTKNKQLNKVENDPGQFVNKLNVHEDNASVSGKTQAATVVYKVGSGIMLEGIEYYDPVVGKCFVFPYIKPTTRTANDFDDFSTNPDTDTDLKVNIPKFTYSKDKIYSLTLHRKRNMKRKLDTTDERNSNIKKYRKGKNIDYPKFTAATITQSAYAKEFKQLFNYYESLKFSYSRPFHKDHVDVQDIVTQWPVFGTFIEEVNQDNETSLLFDEAETFESCVSDPLNQTLCEEINDKFEKNKYISHDVNEINFNMGFGERSGRVNQNLEEFNVSKISAATLSDVKQFQPFLLSEKDNYKIHFKTDDLAKLHCDNASIRMKNKVRESFVKTTLSLKSDQLLKPKEEETSLLINNARFPYYLCLPDFFEPSSIETVVQVVQVGQLPVSAAAQNPVTCDPRVTHVSDASPSQCSVENSPRDDSQAIKTEYTELTTASLSLPLTQDYVQDEIEELPKTQDSLTSENIPIEKEIKSEIKIEIVPDTNEDLNKSHESDELDLLLSKEINNVEYAFNSNNTSSFDDNAGSNDHSVFDSTGNSVGETENFTQEQHQNGLVPKSDQIAHAMNAAGIETTSETMTDTRTEALVNIISQNIRHGAVVSTHQQSVSQTTSNSYPKTTSINAMALQQALAQILPPPLNQTGCTDNNQQVQNAPQLLHIVQGKSASGNQITLVDNSQPSVINNTNSTPVLHLVQNKMAAVGPTSNGGPATQTNSFSGLSLVDTGLQQGGNQLLHIVNTGSQKNNATGQLLKRVNLLTNLTNVQGSNEQKMVQFVCKSADGKSIQLNAPHQRSMVLRLQPIESPNVQQQQPTLQQKPMENQEIGQNQATGAISTSGNDANSQQEIKSRSVYEENYAKFIQNSSTKPGSLEKSTSLPKFNQAFGKQVYQDGNQNQNEPHTNLTPTNSTENIECQPTENTLNLEQLGQMSNPPLLIRKTPAQTSQSQPNIVQHIKQTITPMNIQTMHGGVIYTRQIPVNIGGGQTINLITVPSTELIDDSGQKQHPDVKFVNQSEMEPSIIKIVPQSQPSSNSDTATEDANNHASGAIDNAPNPQPQQVLTQMRIKLPMLSKTPQMVSGSRVVRPSFFQIQRNVISGNNQPVYQQLVLTAAPPLSQQTVRIPQAQTQTSRQAKVESQSSPESQMSSSTLEQLREFDMVLEQVKERSTVQPNSTSFPKIHTTSTDATDGSSSVSTTQSETTQQVLYSIGKNSQQLNVAYVNRKPAPATPAPANYVRSPDSSGIADSPTSSSSHTQVPHTVTSEPAQSETPAQPKPAKSSSKSRSRLRSSSNLPGSLKLNNSMPPKTSTQKPLEDEQTTQRILYILAEYKEQVENSPDKDKPAPRRRTNTPAAPCGSSKRKKSSSGSRRSGGRDMSPVNGDDTCRTMGSEDSSCGTSQGDCNESCVDSHSPQDSPRKVARKLTFEPETVAAQPRPQPQRNLIVADGQTITVARGTAGKPTTAVLMPANYILPVSMMKGGQQIAIVTNRGPKLLTVGGGEGGATNALLLQRLIGPAGLKPMLARPGVRHVRLPAAALHNLQAFNMTTATTVQPPDSTASPAPAPNPPDLVDTRANNSPWNDRESDAKPDRSSSPDGTEPWNIPAADDDYNYEETVRTDNMDRTVLDPIQDRYSPEMEAQRIFDKMFDVESKKSYIADSPRCGYDIDTPDDEKTYHQIVQRKDGSIHRQHRLTHVSAAALRHKYAILEHELRLQKSLSEECEDLGVDSPSASELFPEAELLFAASPAHEPAQEHAQHAHTPQPLLSQSIPHVELEQQPAPEQLVERAPELDVGLGLGGVVAVSGDGRHATIALDQEEFARSHPNTTFHSEPTEGVVHQPFTITGLKARHITSAIFHRAPTTVLMTAPQPTVISQLPAEPTPLPAAPAPLKYNDMLNMPSTHANNINLTSVLVRDDGLTRFDNILTDSRELHLSNTASAIVHSVNAAQVIRRVCYDDDKRGRFLLDEPESLIAGDDAKMVAEDSSRDATMESMADVDDDRSSPERHTELFWESNSASERSESRRRLDYDSDSDKCCKSPSFDETNSTDSSGVGTHMRLDSVIKEARVERSCSADGSSADDTHPPLRTYPPKRMYHGDPERSLSGKTRAGERSPESVEVRRRASGRGVVKRGCHCCNGSPAPPRPKKSRQKKPSVDFSN